MKKWIKRIILSSFLIVPVGMVIGFSTNWSQTMGLSCVGSSGVKPFIEFFGHEYSKQQKDIDVTVEAGGSGFGISQVANGFANVGNASKNPYHSIVNDGYSEKWKKSNIKTITIAWEAICLVYIPPKGMSNADFNLDVNEQNINNLYRTFSGFQDGLSRPQTLGDYLSDDNSLTPEQKKILNSTTIKPYVRTGGSMTSGTADAFFKESHIDQTINPITERQKTALSNGNYGNDITIMETDEANSRAWDMFSKDNEPGSMVYLSSGFVNTNYDLINSKGYKIMTYEKTSYNISNVTRGYNWYRPINSMIPVSTKEKTPAMNFIEWIFSSNLYENMPSIGGVRLTESQIKSMCKDNSIEIDYDDPNFWDSFWYSDYELLDSPHRLNYKEYFGAIANEN